MSRSKIFGAQPDIYYYIHPRCSYFHHRKSHHVIQPRHHTCSYQCLSCTHLVLLRTSNHFRLHTCHCNRHLQLCYRHRTFRILSNRFSHRHTHSTYSVSHCRCRLVSHYSTHCNRRLLPVPDPHHMSRLIGLFHLRIFHIGRVDLGKSNLIRFRTGHCIRRLKK